MIAVVAGASGLTGSKLVDLLLRDESISVVKIIVRKSTDKSEDKIKEVLVPDITKLDQHKNKLRGDIYFNCLGTTLKKAGSKASFRQVDYRGVVDFALIAKEYKARKLVHISATGANSKSRIFYNQVKGEVENALMAMSLNSLTIFRPSLLLSERLESRPMEYFAVKAARLLEKFLPPGIMKRLGTDVDHLVERMLEEGKSGADPLQVFEASEI